MIEYKENENTQVFYKKELVGVIQQETDFYKFIAFTKHFKGSACETIEGTKAIIEKQAAKISFTRIEQYNAYIVDITRTINEQHAIIAELPDNAYKTQLLKSIEQTNKLIEKTTLQDI